MQSAFTGRLNSITPCKADVVYVLLTKYGRYLTCIFTGLDK